MQPEAPIRPLKNRRKILLASAMALGLTGALATQTFFAETGPARAEVVQAQDLSKQNNLEKNAPRQDQIGFADIVETVKPAVVSVRVKTQSELSSNDAEMPGFFKD